MRISAFEYLELVKYKKKMEEIMSGWGYIKLPDIIEKDDEYYIEEIRKAVENYDNYLKAKERKDEKSSTVRQD